MTPRRFPPIRFGESSQASPHIDYQDRVQRVNVDAAALASELRREIKGEVRFDDGTRALYATDASNYRQVPIGVVMPYDADDVVATVALARKHGAPILSRGGGTSLAGQCCNVAVVMDFSKYMHGIIELNPDEKYAWVQPGIVLDDLRTAAEQHHLTFGPDPATHTRCTIGGMIGNNSCGVHALMAGKTVDNIEALKILLYDGTQMTVGPTSDEEIERIIRTGGRQGEIYAGMKRIRDTYAADIRQKYPKIPRRVSGYNLDSLLAEDGFHVAKALVGSESTLMVVLEAKCRLVDSPPVRTLVVLGYEDIFIAADHVPRLLEFEPIGLEGIDDRLVNDMKAKHLHVGNLDLLPKGKGWLLAEFGGQSREDAIGKARRMIDALKKEQPAPDARLIDNSDDARKIWQIRESGLGATAFVPGRAMTWEGWEDSAVDPKHLGKYLRELRALLDKYGYVGDLYGHFGQACVHTRNNFDLESAPGIAKYRAYIDEAADLCIKYNGSLSGEHGDGQSRAELLPKMFGERLVGAFREYKALWDPDWKMNPGKVVTPYHPTENLRLGADFQPWAPATHFQFPEDQGRIERAAMRCVGVGECRRFDHGIMCPSYMVTREEKHSTRGRARLFFEMFEGEVIPNDWNNEAVKDALDLCLACKGCKGECPVNVDMATFKAEFLSHYYEKRLRPVTAYSMGLIYWWSRAAGVAPQVANTIMALPVVKRLAGVAPERQMPVYAKETFREWFRRRRAAHAETREPHRRVLLWPDTFNNHFHPETAIAAVEVLENAGYHVTIPRKQLCCGRPLYDFGFLGTAKKLLEDTMETLQPELEEGIPIIGLEPSCVSVFRDELHGLYPAHPAAKRLHDSMLTLSEFIAREGDRFRLPSLQAKALMQAHCHHRAIMKIEPEEQVLRKMGLDLETPDSGCCGMAGAFGFERDHYDVSLRVGERLILPKVREASPETIIIADGFSCREQIAQTTPRQAMHLAQVLQLAVRQEAVEAYPEKKVVAERPRPDARKAMWTAAGIAGGVALLAGAIWVARRAAVPAAGSAPSRRRGGGGTPPSQPARRRRAQ
jgi:FAD/FMN-containing dehydrogenase/Fe-S oxidoreductase